MLNGLICSYDIFLCMNFHITTIVTTNKLRAKCYIKLIFSEMYKEDNIVNASTVCFYKIFVQSSL